MSIADAASSTSDHWLGLRRTWDRESAGLMLADLRRLLEVQHAAAPARKDVAWWFDPLTRGVSLRQGLEALAAAPSNIRLRLRPHDPDGAGEPFVVDVGDDRVLVTPEGVALLEILAAALSESKDHGGRVRLSWDATATAERRLLEHYRRLSQKRLRSVVALRTGAAPPMLPQAAGLVLFLLLNGNIGEEKALGRPARRIDLDAVDATVAGIVEPFVTTLTEAATSHRGVGQEAYSLYGGYALTEARRRLGADLSTDPVYLRASGEQRILDRLAAELARRGPSVTVVVGPAIEAMVSAYRRDRSRLAAHGLARGSADAGAHLRQAIEEGVVRHLERSAGG